MRDLVGLVLSGGGAKGAYHLGVMKAIQEMNIPIDMIAGTSIGALNGALLASAKDLDTGIQHMQDVWKALPEQKPIQLTANGFKAKQPSTKGLLGYIAFLTASGLKLNNPLNIVYALTKYVECTHLCKDDVLHQMMEQYLDIEHLQKSIPLYVAIFPQKHLGGAFRDFFTGIKDAFKTEVLGKDNHFSEFKHIQSLPIEEQKETILASAALPLLFKAHEQDGKRFTDGGQGGMIKAQGNTPITPLIQAGCKHIIVVHLDGESLWHRHDFADTTVIEVRPSKDLGGFLAMLDFKEHSVNGLIELGYQDAKNALTQTKSALDNVYNLRHSTEKMLSDVFDNNATNNMDNAMARLLNTVK